MPKPMLANIKKIKKIKKKPFLFLKNKTKRKFFSIPKKGRKEIAKRKVKQKIGQLNRIKKKLENKKTKKKIFSFFLLKNDKQNIIKKIERNKRASKILRLYD